MKNKSNLLLDVLNEIPEKEVLELAVKSLYYKNVNDNLIEYTGDFNDGVDIDEEEKTFDLLHFYHSGAFVERLLNKFNNLSLDDREHVFLDTIGNHLHVRFEDWADEIKRLKNVIISQGREYETKLKEWQENHKQLTTAYNELHYEYRQFKKSVNEKEMDSTEKKVEEVITV
jgi:hypothetical protein